MHRVLRLRIRAVAVAVSVAAGATSAQAGVDSTAAWTGHGNQANANYGYSVAAAGDVDGDGLSDLLVGARTYTAGEASEGRAFLYLGTPGGPSATPVWTGEGNQVLAFYGASLASAGDVDGDGYHDILVSAPSHDGVLQNEGRVAFHRGGPSGPSLAPDHIWYGGQSAATFGSCVASAGDINGDGHDDVLVGARGFDTVEPNAGRAFLFHGGAAGPDSLPSWTLDGTQNNEALGWSVAGAGDVNADGYADVIVGAFYHDGVQVDEGAAWVFLGSASGLAATPVWSAVGGQQGSTFGWSVAAAGDVNGDGYADVVVGARYHDGDLTDEGRAYVFHGSPSGVAAQPAWIADGGEEDAFFGWSVASAGDVNGDGFADVVVGAYRSDVQWIDDGEARVYLGGPAGLAAAPVWIGSSHQPGANFGWSVAGAGDVDGDGFGDVVVGAHFHDDGQENEGAAMLFRGGAGVPASEPWWKGSSGPSSLAYGFGVHSAGDVNGDGFTEILVTDPLFELASPGRGRADLFLGGVRGPDTSPAWSTDGSQAGENWGRAAADAGDVNGDGHDDVILGAPYHSGSFAQEGRAVLFTGSPTGLAPFADREWRGGGAGAQLGTAVAGIGDTDGDGYADVALGAPGADGLVADAGLVHVFRGSLSLPSSLPDLTLLGDRAGARFGASAAGAGDVNGDGLADLVVGEPLAWDGEVEEGRAHVYLGGPSGPEADPVWTGRGGEPGAQFGATVGPAGDVDGDGFADVFVVAPLADGESPDEGRVSVFHGSPSGLVSSPTWSWTSGQANAQLDVAGPAGDVNGDGFDDLLVGVSRHTGAFVHDGRVLLFAGSDSGLATTPVADWSGGRDFARVGSSVTGRVDPDGNGWGDLLIGARGWSDSSASGGAAFLFGSKGAVPGVPLALHQRRTDDVAPVALGAISDSPHGFRVRAFGGSPAGRAEVALVWEAKPVGTRFNGSGVQSTPFLDSGPVDPEIGSRASLDGEAGGLSPGTSYRWRARIISRHPAFPGSPWFTPVGNGTADPDVRLPAGVGVPPGPAPSPPAPSAVLIVSPSPFRATTTIRLLLPAAARGTLRIHDVAGRLVATLRNGGFPANGFDIPWNGCDRQGIPVAPGVYWATFRAVSPPDHPVSAPVIHVR